jgi:membrane protein insertase Oxa1/YidC/SpoIIIJ
MLAALFRSLLIPFAVKKRKTDLKKVKLQPYVDKIKERYKDKTDQESVNQKNIEITNLYKSEKISMASGCFSSLLQIPLFIAVYNVITNPLTHICRFSTETISAIEELALSITQKAFVSQIEMLGLIKQNLTVFSSISEVSQKYMSSAELPELTFLNGYIDASRIPSLTEINVYTLTPLIVFVATLIITISSVV